MTIAESLFKKHSLILQAVECLSKAKDKLERYERPPKQFFDIVLEFADSFADKYHWENNNGTQKAKLLGI